MFRGLLLNSTVEEADDDNDPIEFVSFRFLTFLFRGELECGASDESVNGEF